MRHQMGRIALLVTTVALLCGTEPVTAKELVPFKGQETDVLTTFRTEDPTILEVFVSGTGVASHLGRYTLEGHHFFDLTTFCISDEHPTLAVITAANGDQLFATYSVCVCPPNTVCEDGFSLRGEWTIIGGTGRFTNAEGHYTGNGVLGAGTWVLEGEISSPGENKK